MFPQNVPSASHLAVWDHQIQDNATAQDEAASSACAAVDLGAEKLAQALLQNINYY